MPLPGGSADKLGNRYELWWTVSQLVRILHGQAESIRIEEPGVTKAEFVIVCGGRRELHQAKRSHPDGKWSLASLASSDVQLLQGIFAELSGNDAQFVFVSGSDAGELKELAHRAKNAETADEFESYFLDAKVQKEKFEKLRSYWKNASPATVYEILRRIQVRTLDEASLEEHVQWGLRALFLADADAICAELRRIAEDSVHQTITRDGLIGRLAQRGFTLRRLANPDAAVVVIGEVTDRYLEVARKKLIRKTLIPRAATQTLLERIGGDQLGGDAVLLGKAGTGKTGCVVEFVEGLRERGVPVLAFRLDRLAPVSTTAELGEQLDLEESPALVLAAAATGRAAVLVVDQVDAVSTASGRSSDFLEAVEGLLAEARGLRDQLTLHVVIVCRAFDWENDHRLRRMLSGKHTRIEVAEFLPEEVKAIVSAEGFRVEVFQQRQLELLRLPQNLSLLLDAGFPLAGTPNFNTAKELFDRYWDEKRRAVAVRAAPLPEQWTDVIQGLCEEMTRTQQLSVPREKLDRFAIDYVAQMASEGVLTFDGKRYGFGHESFFDYCFARAFVTKDQPVSEFLIASEQHLFRRAQVRQVLAYLRDADRPRYCTELRALLTDSRVRSHIKDLAVAVLMNVPDPDDGEWAVLEPWLNLVLAAFVGDQRNPDKFAAVVWQHFFTSPSWFHLADRRGLVAGWLASGNNGLTNMAVNYLRVHQRHSGDRVAELLEPCVGLGGDWTPRLRSVVEWADHENSRRFFELFLRLIDDGTLDDARDRFASNGTFWSMLYGLAHARPDWVPEVTAHWLRRRFALGQGELRDNRIPNWRDLFDYDYSAAEYFHNAADKAPDVFVQNVLPVILQITDATVYDGDQNLPRRDAVWPSLFKSNHPLLSGACLNALAAALVALGKTCPEELRTVVAELRRRDTYIANFLLLNLYTAGAAHFANEAVALLCDQPWRFDCGFSDSGYWVGMELIRAIIPLCSPDNRVKLEGVILGYSSAYERTKEGYKAAGWARFSLLSGIPPEHRSVIAQACFAELERKFTRPAQAPVGIHSYCVGSPIDKPAAEKMTDAQWLRAIEKYRSEDRLHPWDHPEKGGAWELAGMLREFVQAQPERFGRLSLEFPSGTNPAYIKRILDGLKGTTASPELKLDVCRKAYVESRTVCGEAIADMLGSIEEPLPDDAVQMLDWLATEHPDPDKPHDGKDILTHGINTTRGRAAQAICNLIFADAQYVARFRTTLDRLVDDTSISVRSCVASTLLAVARHDTLLALELFAKLAVEDDRLLATPYADRFIRDGLREHFTQVRPYVERMLRSNEPKVCEAGARLASLAALFHENAASLVTEAIAGSPSQRLGVAQVVSANIADAECRTWCENYLLLLFNDDDREVRREAASCFLNLKNEPLESYEGLITAFCDSGAFQENSLPILHALEGSFRRLPGITCVVCEKFLVRFSDEAKDIRTHHAGDVDTVAKLIFRTYQQHQRDEWAARCLDLIDRMCLEGIHDVKSQFNEFDR